MLTKTKHCKPMQHTCSKIVKGGRECDPLGNEQKIKM